MLNLQSQKIILKQKKIFSVKPLENFPSSFEKANIFISMPMENLCVLTIHNTKDTDGGKWVCHITSKLDENEKNILENTGSKINENWKYFNFLDIKSHQLVDIQVLPESSFGVISGQV